VAEPVREHVAPALPDQGVGGAGALSVPRRHGRYSLLTRRDKVTLGVMVGIPLFLDLALIWGPTVVSFFLSFTNWNGIGPVHLEALPAKCTSLTPCQGGYIIGLKNYQNLVSSYPFFWPALQHNLIWLAFLMFISTPLGMFMAVLLDREIRGTRFYQTVFYLPVVLSLAVIGIIWSLMYSTDLGFINNALGTANTPDAIDWLGNPSLNLWAVLIATSWRHVGYIMVLYLAGLKAFDPALREAATVDGANERQIFFRVVFPVLMPINVIVVVVTTIEALRAFDIAYIVNGGKNGLELLSTLITNNGLSESNRVGFASAIAVILLVISLVPIIAFLNRMLRGETR
jgi:multiple sugar transport system permease protein